MTIWLKNTSWLKNPATSYKVGGQWVIPSAVFVKVSGTWKEVWPQIPAQVSSISVSSQFNASTNLVEVTATWSAPSSQYPIVSYYYQIQVWTSGSWTVIESGIKSTAGTYTFTNGTIGYNAYSNMSCRVGVASIGDAGVASSFSYSGTAYIADVPRQFKDPRYRFYGAEASVRMGFFDDGLAALGSL